MQMGKLRLLRLGSHRRLYLMMGLKVRDMQMARVQASERSDMHVALFLFRF